ncbi:MAG: hypothetical protein HLX50_09055 [Alteromonadaceae bacterium]|nr:hypothetical protein [Alteromonadaceae bacterium]
MTKPTQAAPELVEVELKKDHRHKGKDYPAGETIEVTKAQAERLKRREVI